MAVFITGTKVVAYVTFLAYVLTYRELAAEKIFITLGLLHPLRVNMTLFIPFAVQMMSETKVTLSRVQVSQIHSAFCLPYCVLLSQFRITYVVLMRPNVLR